MSYLKENWIKAVWFDAFWTLIDDSKRPHFNLAKIFKKYNLALKNTHLIKEVFPKNPHEYYEELFDFLFEKEWLWRTYINDVSDEDKKIIIKNYEKEINSYILRPQTDELLKKIKSKTDHIFLISNLSSLYINKVDELLNWYNFLFKLYSCEAWYQKTIKNTDIFDLSSEILNRKSWIVIPKNKILFTWDSNSNDIIAPKNAWFNSINIDTLIDKILN